MWLYLRICVRAKSVFLDRLCAIFELELELVFEMRKHMKKYTVLDLFAGAGGLSRGFYDAGFNVVLGIDFDDAALQTFARNHGDAKAMKLDLFNHDNIECIVDELNNQNVTLDVLVGGPPCQGFS